MAKDVQLRMVFKQGPCTCSFLAAEDSEFGKTTCEKASPVEV